MPEDEVKLGVPRFEEPDIGTPRHVLIATVVLVEQKIHLHDGSLRRIAQLCPKHVPPVAGQSTAGRGPKATIVVGGSASGVGSDVGLFQLPMAPLLMRSFTDIPSRASNDRKNQQKTRCGCG